MQVQLGHATFADLEADAKKVLVDFDFEGDSEPLQKVFDGLHSGLPLHGADLIVEWRAKTRYTPELQLALLEKHWRFFPIWHYEEQLARHRKGHDLGPGTRATPWSYPG